MESDLKYPNEALLILVAIFLPPAALFYSLYVVYKVHLILEKLLNNNYSIKPSEVIIRYFIPVYNLYWIFKWPYVLGKEFEKENVRFINLYGISALMFLGFNVTMILMDISIIDDSHTRLIAINYFLLLFHIITLVIIINRLKKFVNNYEERLSTIICQNCKSELVLEQNEIKEGKFQCPDCNAWNEFNTKEKNIIFKEFTSNEYLKKAISNFEYEKYYDSITDLDICIEINPENTEALYYRGMNNFILKKYKESINDWNNALKFKSGREAEIKANIREAEKKL